MPHIDQTPREYLASLNPPLAKIGRGRLSAKAHEALDALYAQGYTFAEPVKPVAKAKPKPAPAPVRQVATVAPAAPKPNSPTDLAARIMAGRKAGEAKVKTDTPNVKPEARVAQPKVRDQVNFFARSPEGYPVTYASCSACGRGNQICACKAGPQPPKDCERIDSKSDALV